MRDDGLPPLEIVDPHVHFWSPSTHSWLRGALSPDAPTALRRLAPCAKDFWPRDYLHAMQPMRVSHSVYIQANMRKESPVEEAAFVAGMAVHGMPSAFLTYAPLHEPEAAQSVLDACSAYPGFRGVRFMLDYDAERPELCQTDRGDYMRQPNFKRGLALLAERGLIFEIQLCQSQLVEAAEFIDEFPSLTFVLNHAGFPLRGGFEQWAAGIGALARRPNVFVKISGLGCYDRPVWDQDEINMCIDSLIRAFGVDRCMFASNLPVDLVTTTPRERFASYYAAVKNNVDQSAVRRLFRDNALACYRLLDG